jgi:hypothetical protein
MQASQYPADADWQLQDSLHGQHRLHAVCWTASTVSMEPAEISIQIDTGRQRHRHMAAQGI